jgi:pilus assembly protein Flp/PilA
LLIFCDEGENVTEYLPISRFWSDERGATAIEYGLICAMISLVVISMMSVGGGLTATYNKCKEIITALGGSSNNSS